jgi:hypothetical protein
MKPGLDVHRISDIATKYDVGFENIRNPNSVELRALGIKDEKKENTWFFGVAAPMTRGRSCVRRLSRLSCCDFELAVFRVECGRRRR